MRWFLVLFLGCAPTKVPTTREPVDSDTVVVVDTDVEPPFEPSASLIPLVREIERLRPAMIAVVTAQSVSTRTMSEQIAGVTYRRPLGELTAEVDSCLRGTCPETLDVVWTPSHHALRLQRGGRYLLLLQPEEQHWRITRDRESPDDNWFLVRNETVGEASLDELALWTRDHP